MPLSTRRAASFIAIALGLYAALAAASDWLCLRNGKDNPYYKIRMAPQQDYDWIILGSSHAMPLAFQGMDREIELDTGRKIINLAALGAGPLYEQYVLEDFLLEHRVHGVIYAVDSFAFRSRAWNEDRFSDSALLARTPADLSILGGFFRATLHDHVSPLALLDQAVQFSKINNRDRFKLDEWKGETQFDQVMQPSNAANKSRIAYLYPESVADGAAQSRYFGSLRSIIEDARRANAQVVLVKLPLPAAFRSMLPAEDAFDSRIKQFCVEEQVSFADFSGSIDGDQFYFDTDHLNRQGVRLLYTNGLKDLLTKPWGIQ